MNKRLIVSVLLTLLLGVQPAAAQSADQQQSPSPQGSNSQGQPPPGEIPDMIPGGDPGKGNFQGMPPGGIPGGDVRNGRMPAGDPERGNLQGTPPRGIPGGDMRNDRMPGVGNPNNGQTQEDFQKEQEQRQQQDEERMKKEQERNLKMMKQGMQNFFRGLKQMKSQIKRQQDKLKKCGIGIPEEVASTLSATDALVAKAQGSNDFEELQDLQMDLQEKMQAIGESQRSFGMLQGMCQMLPAAEKQIKQAESKFKSVIKQAARKKNLDLSGVTEEFQTTLNAQKTLLAQIKSTLTTDPETAMETLQSDFFPGFEDVFNAINHVDALVHSEQGVKTLDTQLKRVKKNRDSLAKKNEDVGELSDAIGSLEGAVNDLKNLRKQKNFDPEEMMSSFEDAFSALSEVNDILESFGIHNPDYTKNFGPQKSPQFNVPQFQGMPPIQQGEQQDQQGQQGGPQGGGGLQGPAGLQEMPQF